MANMTPTIHRLTPYVVAMITLITMYVIAVVVPGKSAESAAWLSLAGGWMVPAAIVLLLTLPQIMDSRDFGVWAIVNTVFSGAVLGLLLVFLAATFVLW